MSCEETHKQCLADRQAHVRQVMADNPYDTQKELAEKAGVHKKTIENEQKRLLQNSQACDNCNKPLVDDKPLPLGQQPEVLAAIQALASLTKQQRKPVLYWIETFWKVKTDVPESRTDL